MDYRRKMVSNKNGVIVAFILGMCVLQSVRGSTIDLVIYKGKVGHAARYNYPFKDGYDGRVYTYRLFADTGSPKKLCLTFRRFELNLFGRFTIYVKLSDGTIQLNHYYYYGDSIGRPSNSPLPDNIWNQTFCVDLAGDEFLKFTYSSGIDHLMQPGFYLEYQTATPETNVNSSLPCGYNSFTCYNRECVDASNKCKNKAACSDKSHNTFAHAFCMENGSPVQQSGFWANNLDTGNADGINKDFVWYSAKRVTYPFIGPSSDHTGDGYFLYTKFLSTQYDGKMTFNPGKLTHQGNCLSFWYYMDGDEQGDLVADWGLDTVWKRSGSYGAKWFQAQANLFCESSLGCEKEVKITARRGPNPDITISIDDISVMPGLCPFYEADLIKGAWTTDDGGPYLFNSGPLTCTSPSSSSGRTKSWLVSRGRCLVGVVNFDFNTSPAQTVMVYIYPLGDVYGDELLKTIHQSKSYETVHFKIPLVLAVPVKIGFETMFNKGQISLKNVYVVDNECDDIGILTTTTAKYPATTNSPAVDSSTDLPISAIIIGVIVAVGISVVTLTVFLHQKYCSKPPPPRRVLAAPQTYVPPTYSHVPPTAPVPGQVSNPSQPQPFTDPLATSPPPYSQLQQPPPAYGEVCGTPNNQP